MATKKVDFRRLKEERAAQKIKKKIDSPLAKYNNLGQLFCVLCNSPVKGELLWNAHIQSKRHRENFAALKNKTTTSTQQADKRSNTHSPDQKSHTFVKPTEPIDIKRKNDQQADGNGIPKKKMKAAAQSSSLPSDFFDNESKPQVNIPSNDDDDDDDDDQQETIEPAAARQQETSSSGLPSDFVDKKEEEKEKTETDSKTRKPSEELPEGFFDDPKLDAKARKVEYKDPVEQEWEKFQKAIQMEDQISEALVQEDDEVAQIDRQLHELNEQREYFLKAHELRDKQTIIKEKIEKKVQDERKQDESTSSDSDEFEDFFDWRAKKV